LALKASDLKPQLGIRLNLLSSGNTVPEDPKDGQDPWDPANERIGTAAMAQSYPEGSSWWRRTSKASAFTGLLRHPKTGILGAAVACLLALPLAHPGFCLTLHDPIVSPLTEENLEPGLLARNCGTLLGLEGPRRLLNPAAPRTNRWRFSSAVAWLMADLMLLCAVVLNMHWVTVWNLVWHKLRRDPRYGLPLFKGLTRRQVHSILTAGILQQLEAGEILFEKGDSSDTMYAIVSGSLDILDTYTRDDAKSAYGVHKLINRLAAGEVVGEMGFFRSRRRSATVVAAESTELLQINWKMIKRLQWRYPMAAQTFFLNLLSTVCDRLESLTRCFSDQSQVDDLTGLYNKQGFIQLLDAEASRAQRYGDDLTLCLIGVDFEKDRRQPDPRIQKVMIRAICQMLAREIRRTDKLGRIDSQLFAMLAPRTSRAQAGIICQRLRQSLRQSLLGFETVPFQIKLAASGLIRSANESAADLLGRTLDVLQESPEC
jgi:diguanylate cyclase (GGDEF)-like protein